jgi:hypothetical protein
MLCRSEMVRQGLPLLFVVASALALSACGGSQQAESSSERQMERPERHRYGNLSRDTCEMQTADVNLDGRPDQFTCVRQGRVVRIERDLDFDGNIDLYEYFDASGQLIEQEFQLDFDNVIDVVRRFENGRLVTREIATGFGGRMNLIKYYSDDGSLLRIERDTNYDGSIDLWEFYRNGRLHQIGEDRDGDGVPEIFRNVE